MRQAAVAGSSIYFSSPFDCLPQPPAEVCYFVSRHARSSIRDPEFDQPGYPGDSQQPCCCGYPPGNAPSMQPGDNRTYYGASGSDGGDDIANPVDEIQECAFRLCRGLPLDSYIRLRLLTQVLRADELSSEDEADSERGQRSPAHFHAHRIILLSALPPLRIEPAEKQIKRREP
jgi:hypothetical protein